MADVTISRVIQGAKNPAIIGGGFILGIMVQKLMNKIFNSNSVVKGLGAETAKSMKDYAVPLATTALGVGVSIAAKDDTIKKLAIGAAISGTVTVGTQFLWNKNLLSGLNGGVIGSLLGDDEDINGLDGEDEDINGLDGEDEDFGDIDINDGGVEGLGDEETPIAALDIPIHVPPMRDAAYERESISGVEDIDGMIL